MAKTNYVLSKRIARGGMAEIYLGKAVGEDAFQRICAIKRILPHYAQDKEFVEMFRDEAHICKRLQHANIVQVYDFTEVEGSYALIMEHVDGSDLRSLLSACESAKTRLSVPMALTICANSARALHYSHTKVDEITQEPLGIVHRDVSPQNILISYEGDVKITDFGIASAENKITETRPGVVKGKYSYMSPEQVNAKALDGRSDVFALAIVLWESLAMKRLFAGQTEVETIKKVQNCEINANLRDLNPDVNAELEAIVMKGLAKDRKNRYQTAASFEKAILHYLHTHYSDFVSSELGNFLKHILAKKRDKSQDDIKQTLTSKHKPQTSSIKSTFTKNKPANPEKEAKQSKPESHTRIGSRVIEYDSNETAAFRVSHSHMLGSSRNQHTHVSTAPSRKISQMQRHTYRNKRPSLQNVPLKTILVAGLLAIGGFLYMHRFADNKLHIELHAVPNVVSLKINGQKINKGAFARTPLKLNLKPGKYKVVVNRPGYRPAVFDVQGDRGEYVRPKKVVLKKLNGSQLVQARFISASEKLYVNLNNGFYKGTVPFTAELMTGATYSLSFISKSNKRPQKCTFKPPKRKRGTSYQVKIFPSQSGKPLCQVRAQSD